MDECKKMVGKRPLLVPCGLLEFRDGLCLIHWYAVEAKGTRRAARVSG